MQALRADHRSFLSLAMVQQKFQISVNIQVMRLCHLNHCINYSTGIGSRDRITEQPVLPTDCKWTDRVLAEIVCEAAATILQIGLRCFSPVKDIIHRFIHAGIPDWLLLLKPRPESLQNRFFLLETQLLTLFIITGIFFLWNPLWQTGGYSTGLPALQAGCNHTVSLWERRR